MRRLAIVLLASCCACAGEPGQPSGAISSEAAQQLILERDAARDALDQRERELLEEIGQLKAEIRELRETRVDADPMAVEEPAEVAVVEQPNAIAVEILNLSAKPIEVNDSWSKFSWQGVVHNNLDAQVTANAVVIFQDSGGFDLEAIDNRLVLQPNEFRKISGVKLLWAQVAGRVARVSGRVDK